MPMVFSTLCRGRCCPFLLLVQRVRLEERAGPRLSAQFSPLRAVQAALARAALELQTQACEVLLPLTAGTAVQASLAAAVVPALCMGTAAQAVRVAPQLVVAGARVATAQAVEQLQTVAAVGVVLVLVTTVASPTQLAVVAVAQRPLRTLPMVVPGWVQLVLVI